MIHVECNRGEIKQNAERLSRHWYDLAMLAEHDSGKRAVNNRKLFEDVIRHKKIFFGSRYANYDDCLSGNFKLLPKEEAKIRLQIDYENMVKAGMMYHEPSRFSDIIKRIQHLETEINSW